MDKGYTKDQLRLAFRHGFWAGASVMDNRIDENTPTPEIVDAINTWFDDWFGYVQNDPRFLESASASVPTEEVEKKEDDKENSEDNGSDINYGPDYPG